MKMVSGIRRNEKLIANGDKNDEKNFRKSRIDLLVD
jgi:hypothetical protein